MVWYGDVIVIVIVLLLLLLLCVFLVLFDCYVLSTCSTESSISSSEMQIHSRARRN